MAQIGSFPSGGLVAAEVAELAASLACAAADHSRASWPEAGGAHAQAQALRRRIAQLAESGAETYAVARRALSQLAPEPRAGAELAPEPRAGAAPADQAQRDWQLGLAVERAAQAPLELAASAADLAELASEIARRAADDVRADAVIAALLAAAAARAAARLVRINLAVGDKQPAVIASHYAEAAAAAASAAEAVGL